MICKKCSHVNEEGAVFCAECGADLKSADSVTVVRASSSMPAQQQGNDLEMPKNTKHDYSQPARVDTPISAAPGLDYDSPSPAYTPPTPSAPVYTEPAAPSYTAPAYTSPSAPPTTPAYTPSAPVYSAPVTPMYNTTPVYVAPASVPAYGAYSAYTGGIDEKGMKIIGATKKLASSPIMIIAAIALTFSTVFSFVSYFANFDMWKQLFALMFSPLGREINGFGFEEYDSISTVFALFGALIVFTATTLMEIGIWTTVAQGFSRIRRFNTSGLSCIKSAQRMYITLASCSIGYIVVLAFKILINQSKMSDYGISASDDVIGIVFTMLFVLIACIVFYIVAFSGSNGSISRCENSMRYNGSVFYSSPAAAVMMILIAFVSFVCVVLPEELNLFELFGSSGFGRIVLDPDASVLASLFGFSIKMFTLDIFATIATIFFAVSTVCFAVVVFMQRSSMIRVNYDDRHYY